MGREPLRRIFWGQKHDKQLSSLRSFPISKLMLEDVGSQMWRQSQVWSLMMFYPCSHLFTWFVDPRLMMSCWVFRISDPSIHWPHVWFSFGFLPMKYHIHSWRGTGISSAARRPPCWTRMMRQMVSLPAGLTSGIGRREMLPAWPKSGWDFSWGKVWKSAGSWHLNWTSLWS